MKINTLVIGSFLLLFILFSSCKNEEKDTSSQEVVSEQQPIINERGLQVFEGQIDGQYDVIMELNLQERSVRGELIYKSVGVPILLEGGLNNNLLEMKEIINGSSNAKLAGQLENGLYKGIWVKAGSSQKLPLLMKASNSDFASFINENKMNEIKITGTYQMPKEDGNTSNHEIRLKYTEEGQVEFLLEGVSGVSHNQGFLSGIAQLENGEIIYIDKEMKECSFRISFTGAGLEISCKDDKCGFGANVRMSGVYNKTSYEKPEINLDQEAGTY